MHIKRVIDFFNTIGIQNEKASQITALLDVSISRDDYPSSYIYTKCKLKIVSLEKSITYLETLKMLIGCSAAGYIALMDNSCFFKDIDLISLVTFESKVDQLRSYFQHYMYLSWMVEHCSKRNCYIIIDRGLLEYTIFL